MVIKLDDAHQVTTVRLTELPRAAYEISAVAASQAGIVKAGLATIGPKLLQTAAASAYRKQYEYEQLRPPQREV